MTIAEAGLTNWTVDPDLDSNENEMLSRFTGYDREMRHFSTKEKRAIRDPGYVKRVTATFQRCPVPFSLYFWQSRNPNYDLTAFKGLVNDDWLIKYFGETTTKAIHQQTSHNAITVVLTNNLSDENKVSLTSPWIVAHRIAHAMVGDSHTDEAIRIQQLMKNFLKQVLISGYDLEWPDEESHHGYIFAKDYHEIYGQIMGTLLGTMKSARTNRITSVYEWWYETVTQYIVKGQVTLNPLPDRLDDDLMLTRDVRKRKIALKMWAMLPDRLEKAIIHLLEQGRGKVFVV